MARMVTPRRRAVAEEIYEEPGPLDGVRLEQEAQDADDVSILLNELRGILTDNSTVAIYRMSDKGPWEYIKTLTPPINSTGLLDELRDEWGGGTYVFRVRSNNKITANRQVNIAGPKKTPGFGGPANGNDMLPMLIRSMEASKSDNQQMMMTMLQMQQSQSAQTAQLQQAQSQQNMQMLMSLATVLVPLFSKGDTPATMIAALAPLLRSSEGGGLKDTLALLSSAKELLADGAGGGEPADFMTTAIKSFAPMLADGAANFARNKMEEQQMRAIAPPPAPILANPIARPSMTPPVAMPPRPQMAGLPQMRVPGMTSLVNPVPTQAEMDWVPGGGDPVLSLIGPDVVFMAGRYPPEFAADAVLGRLQQEGVPPDVLLSLVSKFNASTDWIADLADVGIDLREHRQWADAFLSALIEQWGENQSGLDNPGG